MTNESDALEEYVAWLRFRRRQDNHQGWRRHVFQADQNAADQVAKARAATERAQALHAALRELVAVWDTGMNVNPDDDAPAFHEWNARFDKAWEAVRAAIAAPQGEP